MPANKTTNSGISRGRPRIAWLAMALLVAWAGCSLAADTIPNLTGAWKGTGQTVGSGQRTHARSTAKSTFISIEFTIRIQRQQGHVFYGITQSKRASEPFVGVVGLDKSIYFADPEGYYVGTLLASNKLELVYLEAGQQSRVAGYAVLKRIR